MPVSPEEEVGGVARRLDEIAGQLEDVSERVEDLENEHEAIKNIPNAVSELKGMVTVLQAAVTNGFDGVQKPLQEAAESSSTKNAIQFAAIVIVPILVALIGAYVAIKTGSGK
jgi:uncharacterized protein YoxC